VIDKVDSIDPTREGFDLTVDGLTYEIVTNLVDGSNISKDNQKLYVNVMHNHVKEIVKNKFTELAGD